ncbi:Protein yellow [Orchesella cincta]|uniref:Protein yellow n=1 Tax=Orchesella cincta TaxID=48709 RepID=A0A1D2MCF9_ORCCI|nr:Protein yellow [Orchesella cincta]
MDISIGKLIPLLFWTILVSSQSDKNQSPLSSYEVLFSWKELDYQFPSPEIRDEYLNSRKFLRPNNIITGVKVYGSRLFVTVPRWKEGVPSTLNYLNYNGTFGDTQGSLLIPYPNWEMNELGNCNSLQYIQSMEIDQFGRMWIVDVGRVNIFSPSPDNRCPPKLLLVDLAKDEIIKRYEFPDNVVSHQTNFLNDIVVACKEKDKCWAYITDAKDAKLVVYNLEENRSWFVHHKTMMADPGATVIPILDGNYTFNVNIDGIALSPLDSNFDRVYYCPLSSYHLYSVSTSVLHEAVNGVSLGDSQVVSHGRTFSQSDGLAMDSQGFLFYGLLANNSIVYFNTTSGRVDDNSEVLLVQNDVDLQWVDTFAFDNQGYLYMTTNRMQRYSTGTFDFSEVNFRVARVFIGSKSYMFSKEDKVVPPPTEPTSSSGEITMNPTNLDENAPDKPVLVGLDKDNEKYKHSGETEQEIDNNQLGTGNDHENHHHDHQPTYDSKSSAPKTNEHVPVVIFLTVLMFSPGL